MKCKAHSQACNWNSMLIQYLKMHISFKPLEHHECGKTFILVYIWSKHQTVRYKSKLKNSNALKLTKHQMPINVTEIKPMEYIIQSIQKLVCMKIVI